jgi:predicted alpha/beta superfamily hydrolase
MQAAEIELHQIESEPLAGERTLRIWQPVGDIGGVLYLHDGQNLFDPQDAAFGQAWEVDEAMTQLGLNLLVVGIDHGGGKRIGELTMTRDPNYGGGEGEAYERFVMNEVLPFIAETYDVTNDPKSTYVGGSSLGGLMSLELLRRHPDRFAGAIVMSPSLWWNGGELATSLDQNARELAGKRVWLDIGTREGQAGPRRMLHVKAVRDLAATLERQRVTVKLTVADGAEHNETAWRTRFPEAVRFVTTGR